MKHIYALIAIAALAVNAFGIAGPPRQFVSRPGYQEFTGQMIVRPLQTNKGYIMPMPPSKFGVRLAPMMTRSDRARNRLAGLIVKHNQVLDTYTVKIPKGYDENSYARFLMATGDYEYVHPNWRCYPLGTPNDPRFAQQWHHVTVQSPEAWDLATGLDTQILAIVDTGIYKDHEDLKDSILPGYNSVDRKTEAQGGDVSDVQGHGTHCAGCAAAIGNNAKGVAGMGWNFKIIPVRTSNDPSGGAFVDDMMDGALWALQAGAKTISVSYSGVDAAVIGTTGTFIKQNGGLLCFAAGNDNRDLSGFEYPDVVVVGASDPNDQKAGFSAYGRAVHVFAPGVSILSTTMDGGYQAWDGTSMATPLVNGALALMWSAAPQLTPQEVQDVLENNCDVIGDSAIFGHGRINQFKNLFAVALGPVQTVSPTSVQTIAGAHVAGDLAALVDSDGSTYDLTSALSRTVGQEAGIVGTVVIPDDPTKVAKLGVSVAASAVGTVPANTLLFLLNKNTGRYDYVGSFRIPTNGSGSLTVQIDGDVKRYVASDKTVKVAIRANVPYTRKRQPAPFTLKLDMVKVTEQAKYL